MDLRDGRNKGLIGVSVDDCSLEHEHLGEKLVGGDLETLVDEEDAVDLGDVAEDEHLLVDDRVVDDLVADEVVEDALVGEDEDVPGDPLAVDDLLVEVGQEGEGLGDALFGEAALGDAGEGFFFVVAHEVELVLQGDDDEGACFGPINCFGNNVDSSDYTERVPIIKSYKISSSDSKEFSSKDFLICEVCFKALLFDKVLVKNFNSSI